LNETGDAGLPERIALMALLISLVALSIDAILPALGTIGRDFDVSHPNMPQLVISALLAGLCVGQVFYGPVSDSYGRRMPIQTGLALFLIGSLVALLAQTFEALLLGRFLQGLGAAGPRVVTIAMVRDEFVGPQMARIMSFVMAVFIIVPAIAPAIGQLVLMVGTWRDICAVFVALASIALMWFTVRQPETLDEAKRRPFRFSQVLHAMRECLLHPVSRSYAIAAGIVFGSFVGFLTSVQQIFAEVYDIEAWFPAFFAVLSLAIGSASLVNSQFVVKLGMVRLTQRAFAGLTVAAGLGLAVALVSGGAPHVAVLMLVLVPNFFCFGILFGNLNALSMEPMGHIAGSAAAVIASLTSLIAVVVGTAIGQAFDGTVTPMLAGFTVASLMAAGLAHWTETRARPTAPQALEPERPTP